MRFSEGGYYGFDEKPFRKYLKHKSYSLNAFAGEKTFFNNTFRLAEKKWAETEMEHLMLIIADTDPWGAVCPIPFPHNKDNLRLILKNSTHAAKLKDFDEDTRNNAIKKLKAWLENK